MKPRIRFSLEILTAGFLTLLTIIPVWAQSYSHARIVRLSFVEGNVTVQRPDVPAWAEAPVNIPLQEGFKLSTGENSFAEIQFENGGTIRLGQFSLLTFTELELAPDGGKINHVDLRQGYATFHPLSSDGGDSLQVGTPYGTLIAQGGTRFRVDLDEGLERVEVFHGAVEVQSDLGAMTLQKESVLVMQPGASEPTVVSQGITEDDWDQWVDDREARVAMPSTGPSPDNYSGGASEATYGWDDLQQYGNWSNVPGAGYGWTPTSVNAGWAPYSNGQWCWYNGWGYTWIGAEPWGWLPYHFGWWEFIAGIGWVWFPGSLTTWSPGKVTWFHGPNWVGWTPFEHRKNGAIACGNHCGGGVVSASTFRHGGLVTSNVMLGINPTSGQRVKEPGIIPSTAAELTAPAVSLPAAQSHGFRGEPAHAPLGAAIPTTATSSPGTLHHSAAPPNSTIVYDPQQDRYINSHRPMTPQQPPVSRPEASTLTTPASNPGQIQPVPVGSRGPSGQAAENQGTIQPNPAGISYARPAPSAPNSNPSGGRVAEGVGQPSGSHVRGEGSSAGGHAGSAPAGGGHISSAPAGGGGGGGGGHAGGGGSGGASSGGHH
ncbi:MAG TPA: DUF6600 domain-containing protein [Terriglobia bacterium]|nr:DUF6600 domain-containing protein [Terriglobia bacterium]